MTSISAAIYSRLTNDAAITNEVSTRIRPGGTTQRDVLPYITYQRVTEDHQHHLTAAAGLAMAIFQIDVWAKTFAQAETIAEAIRDNMDGVNHTTINGVVVQAIHLQDVGDSSEAPQDESDRGVHRIRQDYMIWYKESVPALS